MKREPKDGECWWVKLKPSGWTIPAERRVDSVVNYWASIAGVLGVNECVPVRYIPEPRKKRAAIRGRRG